jgi:predicted transposase/invertase (TIGR01784 family)
MAQERTLVAFDCAIKYLLKNKADYVVLEGFLTTLLGKEIKIKSLTDPEGSKSNPGDKVNRVDVLAEENDGSLIIIELQFTPEIDYFHRMAFGSSKAIVSHVNIEEGDPYSKIRKVYSINIVYFDLGGGKDYIYHGTTTFKGLHHNDILELSPKQKEEFAKLEVKDIYPEFYILKVNQFKDSVQSKLDEWMYYFKNSKVEPGFEAPGLAEANELLEYARLSVEDQRAYDWYEDKRRSADSSVYTAKLEGKAEGREEGLAEGKTEGILLVARQMRAEGFASAVISRMTGLSDEDIERL